MISLAARFVTLISDVTLCLIFSDAFFGANCDPKWSLPSSNLAHHRHLLKSLRRHHL